MFLSRALSSRAVVFALIIFSVVLIGCGGGGGGSPSPGPVPGPGPGPGPGPVPGDRLPSEPADLFNGFSDVSASDVAVFETEEYQNQRGLGLINAAWAYARGAANTGFGTGTGAGVLVGVADTGLDTTHSDFSAQGKVDVASELTYGSLSPDFITIISDTPTSVLDIPADSTEVETITRYPVIACTTIIGFPFEDCEDSDITFLGDSFFVSQDGETRRIPTSAYRRGDRSFFGELSHGTFGSAIAAGAKGGTGAHATHGVAHDANLRFLALSLGRGGDFNPITLNGFNGDSLLDPIVRFHNGASAVVNMSFGFATDARDYEDPEARTHIRNAFPRTIPLMAQSDIPEADRTIYVVSAGNAHGAVIAGGPRIGQTADATSPQVIPMLPYGAPELQGQFLAVVAVGNAQRDPDCVTIRGCPIIRVDGAPVFDDGDDEISFFSNRCGLAAEWCIAAPGDAVRSTGGRVYNLDRVTPPSEESFFNSGTSFAAPHVTGAIAVLIDFFDGQLGNTQIVQRLLATANKQGIYADQEIYGQGLLDLKAATEPVGMTSLLTGTSLSGPSVAASATRLLNGMAFGDAWANAFRAHALSVFDELDAPFPARLVDFVWSPARGFLFDAALSRLGRKALPHHRVLDNGVRLSFSSGAFLASGAVELGSLSDRRRWFASYRVHPGLAISSHIGRYSLSPTREDEFLAPWLGFATDGLSVGATLPFGALKLTVAGFDGYQTDEFVDDRHAIFSAALGDQEEDYRSHNQGFVLHLTSSGSSSWFGFQLGLVNEADGLVGSSGLGALKLGENMQTWFAGGTTGWTFRGWQMVASAYLGLTQADDEVQGSLFVDMSSLISSTMSFGVQRPDIFSRGDRFSLLLTQPLRIESGDARLRFAVARTRYGDVILSETQADLVPSGREIELEMSYFYPLSGSSKLTMAASLIRDRGHDSSAPLEARLITRWQLAF